MFSKKSKFLLNFFLIITILFSLVLPLSQATEPIEEANETETTTDNTTSSEAETSAPEIYNGDLYLIGNNIIMDKLVDGNVFIVGNNVEVTGQINGNLFVLANKLNFNSPYVANSSYICANSVNYDGVCYNNVYIATKNLELTYNSIVYKDLKSIASNILIKGAIGRDVDLAFNNMTFGGENEHPIIYGNLRYYSNKKIDIPEGVMVTETSTVTFNDATLSSITDIIATAITCITTVLLLYILLKKLAPKYNEKIQNHKINIFRLFGLGLCLIISVVILYSLLFITVIGSKLALILILLFAIICLISVPVLNIKIAQLLKSILKIENKPLFYLILGLVSLILYGVTLIPYYYIGIILGMIIKIIAIGFLVDLFLPHHKLTDEEKIALEEAKEKKKQEKLEAKEAKKQAKLEAKKDSDDII